MNADRRIADLTTLNQIAATLNESPDLTSALRASLEQLVRLMGLTTGWMFMLNPDAPNSDAILTLHTPGSALGILDSIRLMEAEVRFEPGDVLLMYTDGISDALNASAEEFGVERLARALLENRHRAATEIVNALVDAIRAFVGGAEPFDDMTMVAVKRIG